MVSIDLDNIIHYHPPLIPTPPCKPPPVTTSSGSPHPPSNQPILIHPLPPRPPCLSYESPQTPHLRRQSPSPVVSCMHGDRDTHLNEFDKELANLGLAEIESQETPGLCFGGSGERQTENINNVQRKELHNIHDASRTNDYHRDDLRLSQDPSTPQNTTVSNAAESGLSSAAGAPASPVRADGSVSPNEPRPIQDPSSAEHRETQISLVDYETEVTSVAVGESCHALTSQHECNVSRDQPQPHNPSTPVPAGDETEPANQWLSGCSSEAGAEPGKSNLPPVMEAHPIQLQAGGLSATQDSHVGVRSDGKEIHSTECRHSDEGLSNPVSPVLQQQEQAGSRSEGEDPPRNLSRSCSVSVVVPVTRSYRLPTTRSTRTGHRRCTGKRKSRAKSLSDVDSDDPDDSDYTDGNDSGVGDIVPSPRPAKRKRRIAANKTQPARVQRESPHRVFSSPAPEEAFANPYSATSLQDIQTIPVRGFLTRQTFLSRVVYSCTFEEDGQPSCPHGTTKAPAYDENLDKTEHTTQPSTKKPSAHATRFVPDEDELLVELKEKRCLPWSRIVKHFPGRTKGSLQVRYSTRLKDRGTGSLG